MPDVMICSKCLASMQTIARGGVIIEHCTGCGGVFLDRGELDQLIEAENRFLQREAYVRAPDRGDADRYAEDHHNKKRKKHKKKKMQGFLEELFDID